MTTYLPRIALTDELYDKMQSFIGSQAIPPTDAAVVRLALAEFLERQGITVEEVHPQRGGDRR
ncbi:MAG: hypothetical protein H6661_13920 [Ardenticatenaceae bacterium]|nr:hypothetical protein [Ardenticatenaceae bacterium]